MKLSVAIKLVVCLGITFSAPAAASFFMRRQVYSDWYGGLDKPVFTPPAWVFGPAWTLLYVLMAIAAFLVWQEGFDSKAVRFALALYVVQLFLNGLWTPLFFGLKMPGAAFVEILLLWASVLLSQVAFWRVSRPAGLLLLPYLLWTSFAVILNGAIWFLNR
jgi:benzodiazapine receptor